MYDPVYVCLATRREPFPITLLDGDVPSEGRLLVYWSMEHMVLFVMTSLVLKKPKLSVVN